MEIAEIVLAPIAFARAAGIATPTLDTLGAIVAKAREGSRAVELMSAMYRREAARSVGTPVSDRCVAAARPAMTAHVTSS